MGLERFVRKGASNLTICNKFGPVSCRKLLCQYFFYKKIVIFSREVLISTVHCEEFNKWAISIQLQPVLSFRIRTDGTDSRIMGKSGLADNQHNKSMDSC